jgi:Flp pilus assembly protein TadD
MVVGPECISVVIGPRPLPALRRRAARRGEIDAQIYAPYAPAVKSPIQKAERVYFRLLLGIVGGIVLVALLGWGGLRAYHSWQERHLVRRAAGFLGGGNLKTAALSARRALQLNPESVEAARMMATVAERAADGTELAWRRQVFELAPGSIDDAIALVRAALRANDIPLAERTLQSSAIRPRRHLPSTQRAAESPRCGTSPRKRRRTGRKHPPSRPPTKPTRCNSRCCSSEPQTRRNAMRRIAALEALRAEEKQRAAATRALIIDGATRGADPQRLRALAADLQSYPDALFSDRLLYVEILRQLRDPGYADYLSKLENDARTNATDAAGVLSWMSASGITAEAKRFAQTLPADLAEKWPVPLAAAEAFTKAEDWSAVQQVAGGDKTWSAYEFMRQAYLTRALRGEGRQLEADRRWAQAQKEAAPQSQAVLMLARTVSGWGWQKEMVDLLWTLTKAPETRLEALQLLYQHYAKGGDTGGVYRVLVHSSELAPEDLTMQNNLAQVSLLLDADPERARKIAADLAQKEPANAAFVSTYAFSLYARGDVAAARQALETLRPEQLQEPSIAAYYGIVLAAAGEKEKAREYLARGATAFLLPEEKALVARAETAAR